MISSHIISDLEKVADYIVFIHEGKICFQAEKDQLLEHYGIVRTTPEQAVHQLQYHGKTGFVVRVASI